MMALHRYTETPSQCLYVRELNNERVKPNIVLRVWVLYIWCNSVTLSIYTSYICNIIGHIMRADRYTSEVTGCIRC